MASGTLEDFKEAVEEMRLAMRKARALTSQGRVSLVLIKASDPEEGVDALKRQDEVNGYRGPIELGGAKGAAIRERARQRAEHTFLAGQNLRCAAG